MVTRAKAEGPKRETSPRARARGTSHVGVDARVAYVLREMANGRWSQKKALECTARWGVGLDAVRKYASQAARSMRMANDTEEALVAQAETVARLEHLGRKAEGKGRIRDAIQAEAEKAKVAGLVRTTVSQTLTLHLGRDEVRADLSEAQAMVNALQSFFRDRHPELIDELYVHLEAEGLVPPAAAPPRELGT